MSCSKISRRQFLSSATAGAASLVISSFTPKEGSAAPTNSVTPIKIFIPLVSSGLPREQTLIARTLTGSVGTPDNFNQWVGWRWQDRGIQNLADEPLWSCDFATGNIINGAADAAPTYSADFKTLTVTLRKGVYWSDGQPFTSADVVYTVQTLMQYSGFNANSFLVANVASVVAVNDFTVQFNLKQANSRFHTTFLDRWGCTRFFPKHIFEKQTNPVQYNFNPYVGCGPYKLHSFDPQGKWTTWVKRDDWARSPTGILYGEPRPKYIKFQSFDNDSAQIQAQIMHQLDVAELYLGNLATLLAQSKTSRAYQPAFPFVINNDPCITGIQFNTARAPFDKVDVRWALALAIDIVEYTNTAFNCSGTLSPVHVPHMGPYPANYIEPLQDWLKAFTLDLGNGETFAPYDPNAPNRVAACARGLGYIFPDTPEFIKSAFGLGWYKYAPDAAMKLLLKNGFTKDANGKWLLPGGYPWKIAFLCGADPSNNDFRNAAAAVQQWQKFGIDASVKSVGDVNGIEAIGDFDACGAWPAMEPWGAGPDLYRVLDAWNSAYIKPAGQTTSGSFSRWSSPAMDSIIQQLRETNPFDSNATIAVGTAGLKEVFKNMPGIPTFGYVGCVAWDQYHWTNWPGSENPYNEPYSHWPNFKYTTPFLKPTGA